MADVSNYPTHKQTYEPIATTTLRSDVSSYTFSGIPDAYADLILQVNNQMSGASGWKLRFNADTGSNYSMTTLQGYSNTASSYRVSNASSIYNNLVFGDSTTANVFTPNTVQISSYANTNTFKTLLWGWGTTTAAAGNGDMGDIVGLWRSTSAIYSIEISSWNAVNFKTGSTFSLYGIAG